MVAVNRNANKVEVYRSDTEESKYLELKDVEMRYRAKPTTDQVYIHMKFVDGTFEELSPKIDDLSVAGQVITSKAQFDTQYALVFFEANNSSGGSVIEVVNNITELELYAGDANFIAVIGSVQYGLFAATGASLVNDGGTIYAKSGGGHWLRQFEIANGICPSWWGAVGDRVADDIVALEKTVAYAILNKVDIIFRSGVYRVTRQLIVGFKFLGEEDMWNRNFSSAPSYDATAYTNARFCEHVHFKGGSNTSIWGDFPSASPTSIVYYGIIGGGNSSTRKLQPPHHGFESINFVGQGAYTGSDYVPTIPSTTNQYGLCVPRAPEFILSKCSFVCCGIGIYGQDLYQSNISDCRGDSSLQGMLLIGHNATKMSNNSFSNCTSGLYLQGAVMSIDNTWLNNCPTGIKIGGSSGVTDDNGAGTIILNGVYLENDVVATYPNVGQIILGDEDDLEASEVSGITIKGLSGATGERLMIKMQNCRQVTLEGSSIMYEPVVSTMAKNTLIVTGESRPVAFTGPGKLYYRDRDITAASFVVT